MFLFEGQAVVINIRAETRNKKIYNSLLSVALIYCIAFLSFFAGYCYWAYADKQIADIFMINLMPVDEVVGFVIICVCFNTLTSYPLQILAAFEIYEPNKWFHQGSRVFQKIKVLVCRTFIVCLVTGIALLVPNFTDFINIAGSLGSTLIGFVIPPLIYMKEYPDLNIGHRIFCYFLMVFGICAGGSSVIFSTYKLILGDNR